MFPPKHLRSDLKIIGNTPKMTAAKFLKKSLNSLFIDPGVQGRKSITRWYSFKKIMLRNMFWHCCLDIRIQTSASGSGSDILRRIVFWNQHIRIPASRGQNLRKAAYKNNFLAPLFSVFLFWPVHWMNSPCKSLRIARYPPTINCPAKRITETFHPLD